MAETLKSYWLTIWVWLKIKHGGLHRFWSIFPLARVPFWYRFFEPEPFGSVPASDERTLTSNAVVLVKRRQPRTDSWASPCGSSAQSAVFLLLPLIFHPGAHKGDVCFNPTVCRWRGAADSPMTCAMGTKFAMVAMTIIASPSVPSGATVTATRTRAPGGVTGGPRRNQRPGQG